MVRREKKFLRGGGAVKGNVSVGCLEAPRRVQWAKPPETDEFLHVKGVFSLIYDTEGIEKWVEKFSNVWRGGGKGDVTERSDFRRILTRDHFTT